MGSVVFLSSFLAGKKEMEFTHYFIERDYLPMIGAHVLLLLLAWNRGLSRLNGFILISASIFYMYYLYRNRKDSLKEDVGKSSENPRKDILVGFLAMILLVYFSDVFLGIVEKIIVSTGFSGSMIGVAMVGLVSAMPELTTALTGMRKEAEGISLGTLIGSNITNPLLGVGIGALISTYRVPEPLVLWDLPFQIVTAAVLVVYLWNKKRIGFSIGLVLDKIGFTGISERTNKMENGVLTAKGGLTLVALFALYIAVRSAYFAVDFI